MKHFILLCTFLVSSTALWAQNSTDLSVLGGINYDSDLSSISGAQVGFLYNTRLSKKIYWNIGLQYRSQRLVETFSFMEEDIDVSYLTLPIAGRFHFTQSVYADLGLQVDILTRALKEDLLNPSQDIDVRNNFFSVNSGLFLAAGYSVDGALNIQFQYHKGFAEKTISTESGTNDYFAIQVGIVLFREQL